MKHEVLHLNEKRTYLLVKDVWYDTNRELYPTVGQGFLTGKVERILSYEEYITEYPESKTEMFPYVSDKTVSGGYIRREIGGVAKYAVNPTTPQGTNRFEKEALMD